MQNEQLGIFENPDKAPLAHQVRPTQWEEFQGQDQVKQRIDNIDLENLPHIVFYGPPGCGKTTLAHLLASRAEAHIYPFNAVLGGVKDLREIIKEAKSLKGSSGKQPLIFIDEIHRFNKAQQDALLPYLETGDFVLFGATTENPNTSLNQAILSRVQRWRLEPLDEIEIERILSQTAHKIELSLNPELITFLAKHSNGDARAALNQLELLNQNKHKIESLSLSEIKKQILQSNRRYDKDSDRHYDVISAFIKSVRGSDVNSSVLWLAVMLDGGEDIEFIARRLIILASEDVGNADPRALQVATSAHYAIKNIGMPEARIILSQATTYLAQAPKSNASYQAIDKALAFVRENPTVEVPTHLRNHHPDKKDYKYPHSFNEHWVEQDYGAPKRFYQSSKHGYEKMQDDFQAKNRS